ncbi:helix-turn-helix domain-containing protein [Streptomyces sp. NK08204]|uniref:helix-turn-helix domain-containing protein n=1 Tax=Streptomyces sp. NK08204 TaxID=2873260 RepID=UPI001CED398A|nr:helix-turn-helix domain-containing protein [Streptomyces sp. NK08204]
MSIEATVWALKYAPPMPPQLLGTLFGLADHADKRGRGAYPSVRTLAAYACKAERSVQRDLKELIKLGLIRPGDPAAAAHIPAERRPAVYDLAMERTVPGGRAGDDEVTQASRVTLTSSRARGGRKAAAQATPGVTPTSGGDAHVTGDTHVTSGVTPTSEWGDAHVATGVTPTSPKPSFEPPTNRPLNRGVADAVDNTAHDRALDAWPEGPPAPIDTDGFTVTDAMRRWANEVHPHVNLTHSTQQFISHYRSTGTRRRNWPEAWRKWIAEDADRAARRPGNVFQLPTGQTLTGTDAKVAGWMAIAAQLRQRGDSA